jgi:hypothetical protein
MAIYKIIKTIFVFFKGLKLVLSPLPPSLLTDSLGLSLSWHKHHVSYVRKHQSFQLSSTLLVVKSTDSGFLPSLLYELGQVTYFSKSALPHLQNDCDGGDTWLRYL